MTEWVIVPVPPRLCASVESSGEIETAVRRLLVVIPQKVGVKRTSTSVSEMWLYSNPPQNRTKGRE